MEDTTVIVIFKKNIIWMINPQKWVKKSVTQLCQLWQCYFVSLNKLTLNMYENTISGQLESFFLCVRKRNKSWCFLLFGLRGIARANRLLSYMSISTRSHRQDVDNILQNSTSLSSRFSLSFLAVSLHHCIRTPNKESSAENTAKQTITKRRICLDDCNIYLRDCPQK